jgi:hypothetical protein
MQSIQSPLPQFFDLDGSPLDAGFVYIGVAGSNPETTPVDLFWDLDGTQPAAQPLRTVAGYITRTGKAALVFVSTLNYSLTVRDRNGRLIYSTLSIVPTSVTTDAIVSALYFIGDLDTGLEHPLDGTIVVKTNGVESFRFNASGVITQSLPTGGEFAVLGSSAAGSESGMRLNQTQATSGIALRLSNSGLNVQTTLRGRGDGGLTAYVGQTAGSSNTSGIQAFDINPDGNVVVGNSPTNTGRIVTIYNTSTDINAYSRLTVQTDSGFLYAQINSVASGGTANLYSSAVGSFNIFTQNTEDLGLGTNSNASRFVLGATGGITCNEVMTFSGTNVPRAKNTAKAWVNFNGTGVVAIRDSFNVTSITDNGVGDYTINFTTAMANANYAWAVGSGSGPSGPPNAGFTQNAPYLTAPSTTALRIFPGYDIGGGTSDVAYVTAIIFGG